jgi:hypothetical protein
MKTQDDYEFEKAQQECTFVPKINEGINYGGEDSATQIRGVDKQMERLQRARQEQFQKKMMTERGMPAQLH